jgi:tripartite-type tricarboxylate transporter receptor subunit TctC
MSRFAAILLLFAATAVAQPYPARPVTLVVPFPPGGGPDLFARILAERLPSKLGQPVVVENRPGVGGIAGANSVAKSAPDGHTLLLAPNTIAIAPHLLPKGAGGGVDVIADLAPVIMPASTPMLLVVHPELGVKSVDELVAAAKKNPGQPYASAGTGSPMHIGAELFKKAAGVDLFHVPYKGVAPSVAAALSGQVKILFTAGGGSVAPHLRAGRLRALAVTEKRRTALFPGIPTLAELGYPGVEVDAWYGVLAPAATPAAVIARLNREINAVIEQSDVRERLNTAGIDVRGGTPEAFGAEMREDYARYGRIVQELGIKAD